jgi:hypothetical protein
MIYLLIVGEPKMKRLRTLINTSPITHSTLEVYKMIDDELKKFNEERDKAKDLKLFVDFELNKKLVHEKNQLDIGSIKYKKVIPKKGSELDLKKRKKPNDNNSLF